MIQYFHGVDKHKHYSSISKFDINGKEISFYPRVDLNEYIQTLGKEDAVVLEVSCGAFYFADLIEEKGAQCFVINPFKFRIIKESWNKTDKKDARNMAYALWGAILFDEYQLPAVYKPNKDIRELRKLFSQLDLLNRQITSLKNTIQASLLDDGIVVSKKELNYLLKDLRSSLSNLEITKASQFCVKQNIELVRLYENMKEDLVRSIIKTGRPLQDQVRQLISIKGVTPLLALAFLSDVGDIGRFKNQKSLNAYLGVCPGMKSSGGKSYLGHINRHSRKLSRTLFTQSIYHIAHSSKELEYFYETLKTRRGVGRARIAVMRKIFGIMRKMLLRGELYRTIKNDLYEKKLKEFDKILAEAA